MKGIILASGFATQLYPLTKIIRKQLLPIFDKPIIYYPLSVLILSGIREILLISTSQDLPRFKKLFGDGSQLGIDIKYAEQLNADGLAQAFIIGEKFIGKDDVALVLGDNIFFGHGLTSMLKRSTEIVKNERNSVVFGYYVNDPERYGVVEFDESGNVLSLEEKPNNPKSHYAVVGLYFFTNDVVEIVKNMKPSARGEFEITSVNNKYLSRNKLKLVFFGREHVWLDAAKFESIQEASSF